MDIVNNKIRLQPNNQLISIPDILKGTATSENFQVSLVDDIFSTSFRLSEIENKNELLRVDVIDLVCKKEIEVNRWQLKIKVPKWCIEKIKEIDLYYRENPQESSSLIAAWYQLQAQLPHQEELILELVLPNKHVIQPLNINSNLQHSSVTQASVNLHTPEAAEISSKQCLVRNLQDLCLLALPDTMGAHSNGWGNFNIKVVDSNDERTVISVTSLYYTSYAPMNFTIPKGFNLVVNDWWWSYWKIQKDLYAEKQDKLTDTNKNLENEKDKKLKELQEQLDNEKNKKIKELEDKIKSVIENPNRDKTERQLELHKNSKNAINDLENKIIEQEKLLKEMGGGNEELKNEIAELKQAIADINTKKAKDVRQISNEKLVDRIASLHKQIDEVNKKLDEKKIEALKQLEDKLNNENQQKIKDLNDKLTKTIKDLQEQNKKLEEQNNIPDKINETKIPDKICKRPGNNDKETAESCECDCIFIINCCC